MQSTLTVEASWLTGLQFLVSTGILLLTLGALSYVINAPAKRNFGVSTMQAIPLFFGQWLQGKQDLEDFLGEFGDRVRTLFGAVVFRRAHDKKIKAFFFVPHLHFGPFGTLGGSEFPAKIFEAFEKRYRVPSFTFHPLVTHDVNPLHASQFSDVEKTFESLIRKPKTWHKKGFLDFAARRENQVAAFGFGDDAFISISRAPFSTEDFDLSAGFILRSIAQKCFGEALVVDRHNAITNGDMFDVGSPEFERFEQAVGALKQKPKEPLNLGVAHDDLADIPREKGIGRAGLNVAVLSFGNKKECVVLIDGNNALPGFRKAVQDRLKKFGFSFVDLFTTDTHSVNTIGGIHNPLGAHTPPDLLDRIENATRLALSDLEPVEAAMATTRASLSVLGINRQTELVSTVNAIVSIAKILAPVALIISFLLVFFALVLVK